MALLSQDKEMSHETIASATGMSARTVYRHFPDRASLMVAVWWRLREMIGFRFPSTEEEIIPLTRTVFGSLNTNENLVKGIISSAASARIWTLPGNAAREAFTTSLASLLANISAEKQTLVIGCFVAVFSAPFWNLLRSRAELSAEQTEEAAAWMLTTLLNSLQPTSTKKRKAK